MWNCRKSVLLPAKRRKAGARPRARVTSRRELRRGESGLRAPRDGTGPPCPATGNDRRPRGSGDLPLPFPATTPPGAGYHRSGSRLLGGLCAGRAARPGSGRAAPPAGGGPEAGETRLFPPLPSIPPSLPPTPPDKCSGVPEVEALSAPRAARPPHAGPCRGSSRRGGEESGSRPGSASPAPSPESGGGS